MAPREQLMASMEGDAHGLALGRAEGAAFSRTLKYMLEEIAEGSGQVEQGDYLVSYAVEEAEGMYVPRNGELVWEPPGDCNIHIEIAVQDKADGRLIPGLDVDVSVIKGGKEIGTHRTPLLWHPYLYHYGRNWRIPGSGSYTLRVFFPAPQFRRHDKKNGNRFARGVDVKFENVKLIAGKEDR